MNGLTPKLLRPRPGLGLRFVETLAMGPQRRRHEKDHGSNDKEPGHLLSSSQKGEQGISSDAKADLIPILA